MLYIDLVDYDGRWKAWGTAGRRGVVRRPGGGRKAVVFGSGRAYHRAGEAGGNLWLGGGDDITDCRLVSDEEWVGM